MRTVRAPLRPLRAPSNVRFRLRGRSPAAVGLSPVEPHSWRIESAGVRLSVRWIMVGYARKVHVHGHGWPGPGLLRSRGRRLARSVPEQRDGRWFDRPANRAGMAGAWMAHARLSAR